MSHPWSLRIRRIRPNNSSKRTPPAPLNSGVIEIAANALAQCLANFLLLAEFDRHDAAIEQRLNATHILVALGFVVEGEIQRL
jgi:hypothetical protein